MAKSAKLVEVRFMYEVAVGSPRQTNRVVYVRVSPAEKGQRQITVDIPTNEDAVDGLDAEFFSSVQTAIGEVEKLKLPVLEEQEG